MNAAVANTKETVSDYLSRLRWDGVTRAPLLASKYLGATDTEAHRDASVAWLVGAAERALNTGCTLGGIPVLVGPQGGGKSSVIDALNGGQAPTLSTPATYADIACAWHAEINPEFVDKAFLWASHDTYRPAHARKWETVPRACFFVGTTNASQPPSPRFMPIACGRIDLSAIRRDRDQLWAEAVAAYRGAPPQPQSGSDNG